MEASQLDAQGMSDNPDASQTGLSLDVLSELIMWSMECIIKLFQLNIVYHCQ